MKNKLWLGILIGVLVSAIIGLTGFIIFDKLLLKSDNIEQSKNNIDGNLNNQDEHETSNQEHNSQSQVVDLSLTDEFVTKMFEIHAGFIHDESRIISDFYEKEKTLVSNFSNSTKYSLFVDRWLRSKTEPTSQDENFYYYDANTVFNEWKKIFGSISFPFYDYGDETYGKFNSDGSFKACINCGGPVGLVGVENRLLRATKSDEEIVLYEVVKFFDTNGTCYSDYNKTVTTTADATIDSNYKFIYKKGTDDNYYFYSVEKIK